MNIFAYIWFGMLFINVGLAIGMHGRMKKSIIHNGWADFLSTCITATITYLAIRGGI